MLVSAMMMMMIVGNGCDEVKEEGVPPPRCRLDLMKLVV